MAQYQLEVGILLALAALGSALTFVVFRVKDSEGVIKLPTTDNSLEREHDPFDVTVPEDLVDGHPIGEEQFWRKVRINLNLRRPTNDPGVLRPAYGSSHSRRPLRSHS